MQPPRRSPWRFLALVLALATPLWLLNYVIEDVNSLPKDIPPTDLLLAFVPMVAAMILVTRESGAPQAWRLLRSAFDAKSLRQWRWYLPILLLPPVACLLSWLAGYGVAAEPFIPYAMIPVLSVVFYLLAVGEEVGHMGYAIGPLQERFGALAAAAIYAVPWHAMHIPSILAQGKGLGYIGFSFLTSLGFRILWVWIYNNTGGNLYGVVLAHTIANLVGTYYVFDLGGPLLLVACAVVTFIWGAATLARNRFARPAISVTSSSV